MGQTASQPEKGRTMKVIGAGLCRTGTTSFGAACSILLDGPCHHGGTQILNSSEVQIKRWIEIIKNTPTRSKADRQRLLTGLKAMFDGYVACTDIPCNLFIEELLQLYPDAKVICTIRDPNKWWASLAPIVEKGNNPVLKWIFAVVPMMRWVGTYHNTLAEGRMGELYFRPGEPRRPTRQMWDRHIAHLKKVVPADRLMFFDVRDGWEPLCKMLDVPVPQDVPFPKLNDAAAMEGFIKARIKQGLIMWAVIVLVFSVVLYLAASL
jgi:hypothetical protein